MSSASFLRYDRPRSDGRTGGLTAVRASKAQRERRLMAESLHPAATHHLPSFITSPGETDVLMVVMAITSGAWRSRIRHSVSSDTLSARAHAHRGHKLQFEIVAVLCLISLFTHMHIFWIAGLLLALDRSSRFWHAAQPHRGLSREDGRHEARRRRDRDAVREHASTTQAEKTTEHDRQRPEPATGNGAGAGRSADKDQAARRGKPKGADPCLSSCCALC